MIQWRKMEAADNALLARIIRSNLEKYHLDIPGTVYYDRDANTYRVWFDSPDREKALESIGDYILDHVSSEIRTHESFINRLEKEKQQAINLLNSVSKD